MKYAMIATWRMAVEGITSSKEILEKGGTAGDAIENAIKMVEDYPFYKSVGYGGLPNEDCEVELDAAYMDGDTLDIGAVAGIKDYKNPISIARKLSKERFNCFLVGAGAEAYAHKEGFERVNMLTDRAKMHYQKRRKETIEKGLSPYDGHDTVGMIALDSEKKMVAGTSTSGLFMKKRGRVGDSPLSGSGFYVDSEVGGASATGLGEDLMKGCISYEIVRLMKEGYHPQEAADKAVEDLNAELRKRRGKAGDLSVVCLNNKGEFGVATNIDGFSFSVMTDDMEPTVYVCKNVNGKTTYEVASEEWLDAYLKRIKSPITFD
ncbi:MULTISPECIES: N(4)-(beta-N-acetylglucosaminyl)-L-asparaginase [Clostridium]|uniref:N(4)-(beta-N-acetylglucosaminyl)-L-asparaginase n=1 Tax=Clostridium TaxID=1485 RepID=UPI0018994162|nr:MULTISPECIES: N(4)-(beta-N-acetylglucosaminyl)-L-asparaginase [Clostridium]MDU1935625.1 N(4)-(beta-N-acetylglucosaminyl)-L-asparaginase [Clostridium sp.]MDU2043808.1 N(4)-(beta-N-acetylglucosaminyl)-L-asparaginase [Clostridium sp.]MDU5209731.1 N(4)-(beta-N-acetylglucosaminyl)-L-asparaginase [Clostridium sp.]MDU6760897.1 N(4)-(beta-N-acetylglucosaminyl)-L-asparaginase [Clostridium sp.]MDU7213458.1 N(4)-(beta-N-acetylglucosaminyl)-L-asparaginase [Clostridium sp.]